MAKESKVEQKPDGNPVAKKVSKPAKDKMIKIKESEHAQLIEEAAKYKDQYVRLYAEFENARKRMDREKAEFVRYANEELVIEFLGIMDNLQRTVDSAKSGHNNKEAFVKGIEMVMTNVHDMLKKQGVEPIDAEGKQFDPHAHEALMQEETDEYEEGVIIEELQKGFRMGEKIVRTAKVKIAKKKAS